MANSQSQSGMPRNTACSWRGIGSVFALCSIRLVEAGLSLARRSKPSWPRGRFALKSTPVFWTRFLPFGAHFPRARFFARLTKFRPATISVLVKVKLRSATIGSYAFLLRQQRQIGRAHV